MNGSACRTFTLHGHQAKSRDRHPLYHRTPGRFHRKPQRHPESSREGACIPVSGLSIPGNPSPIPGIRMERLAVDNCEPSWRRNLRASEAVHVADLLLIAVASMLDLLDITYQ